VTPDAANPTPEQRRPRAFSAFAQPPPGENSYAEAFMKDFFVGYNRHDCDWAEWIAWQLEDAGYSVVIQAWDFRPGENFALNMHRAALETRTTIAVLSPTYLHPVRACRQHLVEPHPNSGGCQSVGDLLDHSGVCSRIAQERSGFALLHRDQEADYPPHRSE